MPSVSHRKPFDYVLLGLTATIVLFGLLMLASASGPLGYDRFADSYYLVKHQFIFGLIPGLIGFLIMLRVPYMVWRRFAPHFLILTFLLLIAVFIPGIAANIGTAHSWISIGGLFSLQPSEFVKLTLLFYLAAWMASKTPEKIRSFQEGFLPFVGVLSAVALLMILQPDIGTLSIIGAIAVVVYFAGGAALHWLSLIFVTGLVTLGLLIGLAPYRLARFTTFLNPELDPLGIGYHVNQALLAIGSGGFLGQGYGHSRQKFQYLPEVASDSIFAVISEELGFMFATALIVLFVLLTWRILKVAKEAPDNFGKLVAVGIAAWIAIQAFVNIGAMVAILPITGVPLPFISYGGTSLAMSLTIMGLVLNISRYRTVR